MTRPGSRFPGSHPTLRQDHPGNAGRLLRRQPAQPGPRNSGERARRRPHRRKPVHPCGPVIRGLATARHFLQDAEPSLYLYVQRFTLPGGTTELERRGIIALGRIEECSTASSSVTSRPWPSLRLIAWNYYGPPAPIWATFMLYSDPAAEIDAALVPAGNPDLEHTGRIRRVSPGVEDFQSGPVESGMQQDAGQETGDRRWPSSL